MVTLLHNIKLLILKPSTYHPIRSGNRIEEKMFKGAYGL